MKFSVEIRGSDGLSRQLKNFTGDVVELMNNGLERAAIEIHAEAVKSMRRVSRGRAYPRPGGKVHIASKPGDAPNIDTGQLVSGVKWEIDRNKFTAQVGTNVKYGAELEFGRVGMEPRPWLRPAMLKVRDNIVKYFKLKKLR